MSAGKRFLLDTNVLSETRKVQADQRVMSFLAARDASSLFLSVLTIGELRKGVVAKRRSDPGGADRIGAWVEGIELTFADRILPVDTPIARLWGELSADRSRPVIDTLIAATALAHDLTLVTRNAEDFLGIDVPLVDPWEGGPDT